MVLALGFDTRFARSRPLDLQVPFSIRFETVAIWRLSSTVAASARIDKTTHSVRGRPTIRLEASLC